MAASTIVLLRRKFNMINLSKELQSKEVRRNNKYSAVVNLLVYGSLEGEDGVKLDKIFPYIKDLIVFAAMVGKRYNIKEPVEKENTKIILGTFEGPSGGNRDASVDQHNVIFMFGLAVLRDMKYLRDDHVDDVIKVFEEYSNGGLSIIEGWLRDCAWNPMILLDKIVDELNLTELKEAPPVYNPF